MPAKCPPSSSTSRQAKPSLRRGSLDGLQPDASCPARSARASRPGLAQCAVTSRPSSSMTSARNRLYRRSSVPRIRGLAKRIAGDWTARRDEDKPPMPNPTAAMLTIGDEILSGRTRDSNMPHLAQALAARGIALRETRVVPDDARRDRRGAERAPRPLHPRLHLGRHRPDPRRHHRRRGRRGLRRRHRRARGRPRHPRRELRQPGGRAEPGAPADGAHPRRRRADREPGVAGAGLLASATSTSWPACRRSSRRWSRASCRG